MDNSITVILNGYKRGYNLDEQLEAIQNQTIKPNEILLWYNNPGDNTKINFDITEKIPTAFSSINMGVWARFAYALNAKSKYVCIFDDDTIPGKKWLENCLNTEEKLGEKKGLLGTVGLLYTIPPKSDDKNDSYFHHYIRFGWQHPNKYIERVDLVGHSWFFKKEWLGAFWSRFPDTDHFKTCGEDMHFSYSLQQYGINTYVPPHPPDDIEMWGSIKGSELGGKDSLWTQGPKNQRALINEYYKLLRSNGWKLINDYDEEFKMDII